VAQWTVPRATIYPGDDHGFMVVATMLAVACAAKGRPECWRLSTFDFLPGMVMSSITAKVVQAAVAQKSATPVLPCAWLSERGHDSREARRPCSVHAP